MKLDFHSSCWKRALLVEGKKDARGSAGKMHTLLCTSSSPPFRSHPTTFKTQTKRTTPTTFTPQNACIYATTHQDHTNQSHQPKKKSYSQIANASAKERKHSKHTSIPPPAQNWIPPFVSNIRRTDCVKGKRGRTRGKGVFFFFFFLWIIQLSFSSASASASSSFLFSLSFPVLLSIELFDTFSRQGRAERILHGMARLF